MKHLFSKAGLQALQEVMSHAPLLAFDFDGTLAPIVARPDDACVPLSISQHLQKLASMLPTVIVTGRQVADVTPRLNFQPRVIVGNHGAEDPGMPQLGQATWHEHLAPARDLFVAHQARLDEAGVQVEDKGHSMALHYRLAKDHERAVSLIASLLGGLGQEVRMFGGKCVVNIVSASAPDKGDAVLRLALSMGATHGVFIGDDVNDEPVFRKAPPDWLTVRIGRDDPMSSARFFLDSHSEVAPMLQSMIAAFKSDQPPPGPSPTSPGQCSSPR